MKVAYSSISVSVIVIFQCHGSIFQHYCYRRDIAKRVIGNREKNVRKDKEMCGKGNTNTDKKWEWK